MIGGEFRSRVLKAVPGIAVRPTPDRLRETLFNVLAQEVRNRVFLDAYAGSGAVGIEALSRGAAHTFFLESEKEALAVIEFNLQQLGLTARASILRGKVRRKLLPDIADIAFLDPPYPLEAEYGPVLDFFGTADRRACVVVAQHSSLALLAPVHGRLARSRVLTQGTNALSFYRPTESGAQSALPRHTPES